MANCAGVHTATGGACAGGVPVGHPTGSPHQHVRAPLRRELHLAGRVVTDQALPDRAIKRGPQRGADVRQCRRRVPLPEPVPVLRDGGEKRGQLTRGQLRQLNLAQMRDEESFDVLGMR